MSTQRHSLSLDTEQVRIQNIPRDNKPTHSCAQMVSNPTICRSASPGQTHGTHCNHDTSSLNSGKPSGGDNHAPHEMDTIKHRSVCVCACVYACQRWINWADEQCVSGRRQHVNVGNVNVNGGNPTIGKIKINQVQWERIKISHYKTERIVQTCYGEMEKFLGQKHDNSAWRWSNG